MSLPFSVLRMCPKCGEMVYGDSFHFCHTGVIMTKVFTCKFDKISDIFHLKNWDAIGGDLWNT